VVLGSCLPKRILVEAIGSAGHALDAVAIYCVLEATLSDRSHNRHLRLISWSQRGNRLSEPNNADGVRDERTPTVMKALYLLTQIESLTLG
jgi:hypothetical protein